MTGQVKQTEPTVPLKYIRVFDIEQANKHYREEGYTIKEPLITIRQEDMSGRIVTDISYLMSLQEPSKYDDVTMFKKLSITFDETQVPEGWTIIHHTSKEMILVKKRVEAEEPTPNLDPRVWKELVNMEEETDVEGGEPDTIITEGNGFGEEPCRQR